MNKYAAESKAAQKRFKEYRACKRKKAYTSEEAAARQIDAKVYECKYCGLYHRSQALATLVNILKKRRITVK